MIPVKVRVVDKSKPYVLPTYESANASGADIEALDNYTLGPHEVVIVPTNLSVEIPIGYELQVRPRSGFSTKRVVQVINSPGTIDSDYRGELKVALFNPDGYTKIISAGTRFAQLVLAPVVKADFLVVDSISTTLRGDGGFGSTDTINMCAKCGEWINDLYPSSCSYKPELESGSIGMHHCPCCGIMVIAGVKHPWMCTSCNLEIESLEIANGNKRTS